MGSGSSATTSISTTIGFLPNRLSQPSTSSIQPGAETQTLSAWSRCSFKRIFDLLLVVASLPATLPLLLLTAIAVRLTSFGPVLFRQRRMGRHGRTFIIYKFRTMPVHARSATRPVLTTVTNQRFTPIGPFLRRWKLDELPQIFNVLRGEMSIVGPRPKLPELHSGYLACRPGITGRASLVFAREEFTLSALPPGDVDDYYQDVIRPLKQALDDEYMATATFSSDMNLILRSVLRRWDDGEMPKLPPGQVSASEATQREEVSS